MNLIIIDYIKIRLSYLMELCKILNNDMFNLVSINHDNVNDYDEIFLLYDIVKSNNKIVCINKDFKIFDINQFSLNQIALMKIKYSSFGINFPNDNNHLTDVYLNNLKENLNIIVNQIRNYHTNTIKNEKINKDQIFIDNMYFNDKSKLDKYFMINIKYYLSKFDDSINIYDKMKLLYKIYSFVYNMFNFAVLLSDKFKKTIFSQIDCNRIQTFCVIYNDIYNNKYNLNIDIIDRYNKILIMVKILYIKNYTKDILESYINEINYINKLNNNELIFVDIINNNLM